VYLNGSIYNGGAVEDDTPHVSFSVQTVESNGSVTTPANFYGDITVGVVISTTIKTLPVSFEAAAAAKGMVKNVSKVYIRAAGEGTIDIAPEQNSTRTVPLTLEAPAAGEIPAMREVPVMGHWDDDAALTITHEYPGPFMLQSMVLEVATGG
jgi:hypothetical protein